MIVMLLPHPLVDGKKQETEVGPVTKRWKACSQPLQPSPLACLILAFVIPLDEDILT